MSVEEAVLAVLIIQPPSQQKAGRARGSSKPKAAAAEVDDEQEEEMKSKPVPARYIRGPPLSEPQSQQVRSETTLH